MNYSSESHVAQYYNHADNPNNGGGGGKVYNADFYSRNTAADLT
jgi:hypothetical protein